MAPSLATDVGVRKLNISLPRLRNDVFSVESRLIPRDAISHASFESIPAAPAPWELWRSVVIRYILFEISPVRAWISLVARSGSMGVRAPADLGRRRFADWYSAYWQLSRPDMILWIRQGPVRTQWPFRSQILGRRGGGRRFPHVYSTLTYG